MTVNPNIDTPLADAFKLARSPEGIPVSQERIGRWNETFATGRSPLVASATSWRTVAFDPETSGHVELEHIEGKTQRGGDLTWIHVRWDDEPDVYRYNHQSGNLYTLEGSKRTIIERGSPEHNRVKHALGLLAYEALGF